jgi:regulator of replication initiation timing
MKKIINNLNRLENKFDDQKEYISSLERELENAVEQIENLAMENKNFAEYLEYAGYPQNVISDIAYNGALPPKESYEDKLKKYLKLSKKNNDAE